MTGGSDRSRELIEAARRAYAPGPRAKARVKRNLDLKIAALAAGASGTLFSVTVAKALTVAAVATVAVGGGVWVAKRARPAERLRFLKAYGGALWPAGRTERHRRLREWAGLATESLLRFLAHHDRRCLGAGRSYEQFAVHGLRGARSRDGDAKVLAEFFAAPASAVRNATRIHTSWRGSVDRWQPDGAATEADGVMLLEQVERLLSPAQGVEPFARRYYEALQRQPAVITAHGDVRRVLKRAK